MNNKIVQMRIEKFRTGNAQERLEAVNGLKSAVKYDGASPKDVIPTLSRAIRDPDVAVRLCTAEALGSLYSELAVEPLCIALKDRSARVRQAAVFSLQTNSYDTALPHLHEALSDPSNPVRMDVIKALGRIAHPDSLEFLCGIFPTSHIPIGFAVASSIRSITESPKGTMEFVHAIPFLAFYGADMFLDSDPPTGFTQALAKAMAVILEETEENLADYLLPLYILAMRRIIPETRFDLLFGSAFRKIETRRIQIRQVVKEVLRERTPEQDDEILIKFMRWSKFSKPKLWAVQAFANVGRLPNLLQNACDDALRIHESGEELPKELVLEITLALYLISEGEKAHEKSGRFLEELESFLDSQENMGRIQNDFSANPNLSEIDLLSIVGNVINSVRSRMGEMQEIRSRARSAFGKRGLNSPPKSLERTQSVLREVA